MLANFFSAFGRSFASIIGELTLQTADMSFKKLANYWKVLKKAAIGFNDDNGFKLAASLSYSMIFSISPLLIVVISLAGIFWGQQAVEGRLYAQIKDLIGPAAAIQI